MKKDYYQNWKAWRNRIADRIYYIMGDSCVICGYNKCRRSLHFHHIDPSQKEFRLADIGRGSIKWDMIVEELKKCTIVCANCHGEIHDGLLDIEFKSTFSQEKLSSIFNNCEYCNAPLPSLKHRFCNKSCKSKYTHTQKNVSEEMKKAKSIWSVIELDDIIDLLELHDGVMYKAAQDLNLSDNGLKKHFRKLCGFNNYHEYNLAKQLGMI